MNNINEYISEKLHLRQGIDHVNDQFTKDMKKLFKLFKGEMGQDGHHEYIVDMMEFDDNYDGEKYVFNENVFRRLLYSVVNYDLISLYGKKINVSNSNHPDIARIMKKYATKEMIESVYNSLFSR